MASLPIKEMDTVSKMKNLFLSKGQIRDYLLFILSINTGINLKDLLGLRVKDVKNKQYLKLGQNKSVPLNNEIQALIEKVGRFGRPLDRTSTFYIFKSICTELGVEDKYSVASWRKTFAYHYYQKYKDLSYLQWLFNQSTVEQTLKYIGIDENMNLRFREGVCL